jgi:tripartite-type tricarboxylate transporter receptor subunit TctC
MPSMGHWSRVIGLGLAVALPSAACSAQAWPQRTVRVILPNPPGIAIDSIARLFAERLAARWGQPVIVENMPGADGIIAVKEFVGRRDDHTLLYSFAGPITINPLLHDKLPYDPARDLVPIASTSDNFLAIAASASSNVGSLGELAQAARARTGKLTWAATPGLPYYALAAFQKIAGGDMVQASYRDFNQAIVDLGEGRIDAVAAGVSPCCRRRGPARSSCSPSSTASAHRSRSTFRPSLKPASPSSPSAR